MKLAYWMYAGPAHIGTLRIASSFKNVHGIMHAPLGDDYFNVMRSMLTRERDFTPVTTSVVDRHVLARGSGEKVVDNITRKDAEEHPDLILIDMSLPGMDGWEATKHIKADPVIKSIPVIALTAHAMVGDREKSLKAGCDDYDTKPVEFSRLLQKIENFLSKVG